MNVLSYPDCIEIAKEAVKNPSVSASIDVKKMTPKIRFAILTSCESGCDFCHLEGEKAPEEIGTLNNALSGWKKKTSLPLLQRLDGAVTNEDVDAVILTAKNLNANAIHLTGGEPTLHPGVSDFIQKIRDQGLKVVMTTHGEIGEEKMSRMIESGLDSFNFSLHALEPQQYVEMDLVAQEKLRRQGMESAVRYAEGRLKLKKANIERIAALQKEEGKPIAKINSVVRNAAQSIQILLWAQQLGIECRFQKNLNEKQISDIIITNIIKNLQARLSAVISSNGDSTRSSLFFSYPEGETHPSGTFIVKEERIRDVYLDVLCTPCDLKGTDQCRERFYGIRAGKAGGTLCMDTRDANSNIDLKNPTSNPLLESVKNHYENAEIQKISVL